MPFYVCTIPEGALDLVARERVARAITDIHCDETGAPPSFVHVAFAAATDPDPQAWAVFGTIRAGRTDGTKAAIRRRMAAAVGESGGVPAERVTVTTVDIPASWVMEGGALLPEPGEEDSWLAAHD